MAFSRTQALEIKVTSLERSPNKNSVEKSSDLIGSDKVKEIETLLQEYVNGLGHPHVIVEVADVTATPVL